MSLAPDTARCTRLSRPFVGRDAEISALTVSLAAADRGDVSVVVISGEPGIGKSWLVGEFLARATAGLTVIRTAGSPAEVRRPYRAWLDALQPVVGADINVRGCVRTQTIRRLLDDHADPPSDDDGVPYRYRGSPETTVTLSREIASLLSPPNRARAVVLVLEDLQWVDPGSLQVLELVMRGTDLSGLMLVATTRREALGDPLLAAVLSVFARYPGYQPLPLDGLRLEESRALYEIVSGESLAHGAAHTLQARTDGNPLFVVELARVHCAGGYLGAVPSTLRAMITERTRHLPHDTRNLFSWAAVIGRVFTLELLAQVVRMDAQLALTCLEAGIDVQIVVERAETPGTFAFRHELIRDAFLSSLSATRIAMMHRAVAEAIEAGLSRSGARAEIVDHLIRAGTFADPARLLVHATLAGEEARRCGASRAACDLIERALEVTEARCEECPLELAAALATLGRALVDIRSSLAPELLRRAFGIYERAGEADRAVEVALTPTTMTRSLGAYAMNIFAFSVLPDLRARASGLVGPQSTARGWLLAHGPYDEQEQALEIATSSGDTTLEMWVRAHMAIRQLMRGEVERSRSFHARALDLALRSGSDDCEFHVRYWSAYRAVITGDRASASAHTAAISVVARRVKSDALTAVAAFIRAFNHYLRGEWRAAEQAAEEALATGGEDEPRFSVQAALKILAMCAFEQNHPGQGYQWLDRLRHLTGTTERCPGLLAVEVATVTGDCLDPESARGSLAPQLDSAVPFEWGITSANTVLALVEAVTGTAETCAPFYCSFTPLAGFFLPGSTHGRSTDRTLGLLARRMGRLDDAVRHLRDAVAFLGKAGYEPRCAWCLVELAETLGHRGARGDDVEAQVARRRARDIAQRLSMHALLDRIGRNPTRGADVGSTPARLSARELDVLSLVARGFTNREIGGYLHISHVTVATHMRTILRKTGMANRAEATAMALREGLLE